uniref:Uncharacterized protein n=1 Tax=Globodera rostochiensis TaxID=31243 RepID=A0A914HRM5_GLORO
MGILRHFDIAVYFLSTITIFESNCDLLKHFSEAESNDTYHITQIMPPGKYRVIIWDLMIDHNTPFQTRSGRSACHQDELFCFYSTEPQKLLFYTDVIQFRQNELDKCFSHFYTVDTDDRGQFLLKKNSLGAIITNYFYFYLMPLKGSGAEELKKKREERRASAAKAREARTAKKERDNGDDVPMPPPDAGNDPSTAAPVPEIVEEPPATPALEFNFCPPPAEVTPPPATPGDNAVEERLLELQRQLRERDDTIDFLRLQLRNREADIADLRSQLPSTSASTSSQSEGRPAKNVDELKRSAHENWPINSSQFWTGTGQDRRAEMGWSGSTKDAKQPDEPMRAEDALLILALVGTQKAYAKLKRTLRVIDCKFDVVPSLKKVVEIKRQICAPLCYETVGTGSGVGFWCADIEKALTFRLRSARDNLKNISTDVLLKISGDYGQGFTKITISFGEAQRPNSPSNNFIAAVFPAKDSWANLELYCGSLWTQNDQLKSLAGKSVKWFLGGDVSFVWAVIGHCGSAVTTFPSPVCTCRRDQLLDAEACCFRSVEETVLQAQQFAMAIQRGETASKMLRATTKGIVKPPLLPSIDSDRELERQTDCEPVVQQFLRRIGARREQFRKKDLTGNSIRKILLHAAEMAQPLLAREVGELEDHMDNFKAFLHEQPEMRLLLAHKPKAHLLLVQFVPFARQHRFLGLMDEQGDEALHSVWRRLEQFWKTMPDAEQMRQQLENHFVSNWLLDTGKFEEMQMLRMEEQSTGELEEDRMDE